MRLPILSHLSVLQLEEYSIKRYWRWWLKHPLIFSIKERKRLERTLRAGLSLGISVVLMALSLWLLSLVSVWVGMLALVILNLFPFPVLALSQMMLSLPLYWVKQRSRRQIKDMLAALDDLKVVGITGSFGKTSMKQMLFEILDRYAYTVKTPESYNTILGIKRVMDYELVEKVKYFLVEMGAYGPGDIEDLAGLFRPRCGVITGVGKQHLERFGSEEAIMKTKLELAEYGEMEWVVVNVSNPRVKKYLQERQGGFSGKVVTYGLGKSEADFKVSSYTLSPDGMRFLVEGKDVSEEFEARLFGTSQLENLLGAIVFSLQLGVPVEMVKEGVRQIRSIPHRLELHGTEQGVIIDNAYSSNETGFYQVMDDLGQLEGERVLITPGIVELGDDSDAVHFALGERAACVFDAVVFVGDTERTRAFKRGLTNAGFTDVSFIEPTEKIWQVAVELAKTYDWVLLENDLPQQYY